MTIDRQQPNEHAGTSRPGRASLGRRLTLATLVVLGAAFAISGSLQLRSTRDALTRQMDGLGSTLARSAAASMVEWVLERRYTYVQTYVDSVVSEDPRVGFMAVTLPDGTVIAARPDVDPRADAPIPDCRVFRAPIRVPADPSLASLGTVNLGLRAEHAAQLVTERTRETLTIFTATFAALVLVVTWLLRSMLHQPLLQLDDQARRLGRGDLERPVTVDSRTELGRLAQTLDHMRVNLRASHQSIAQQNEQLLVLDRMKAEFLANLSHELRTPLTAMIGFTSLLAESDLPAEAAAQVEPIRRNALHLHSLLNELLDLARLGTGELLIENCPFDPRALLVDLAEFLRPRATGKGLALTVTPREPLPAQVIGDPTRVRQVLLQVVGNAIKFTERGEVALELSATTRDGTPWIEYRVRDTGPGVPPALQARLFAPWTQGDGALSRRVQGLGIGLSIAREIAARLGGDLRCTSAPEEGSTFTFALPVGVVPPAAEPEPPAEPRHEIRRVLLAEDAPDTQRLISVMLRKAGFQVTVANDGRDACAAAERAREKGEPFDLILMDVQMPELDGCAATEWLRAHGFHQPIVAVTAHSMESDRKRCLDAGCDDYLTKPLTPDKLIGLVRRRAREWSARAAAVN